MNMIKALDTILRLGGIVYIFCIFIGLVITFIQIKFPAVEKMLRKIFQNKAGLILTVSVSLWAVLGVMYTAFESPDQSKASPIRLLTLSKIIRFTSKIAAVLAIGFAINYVLFAHRVSEWKNQINTIEAT